MSTSIVPEPKRWTVKAAAEITGSFSEPSKMPAYSYGIPAEECRTGRRLAEIAGTICSECYALKGHYHLFRRTVKPAQYKRFDSLTHPLWAEAMSFQIRRFGNPFFRWHDSGDLQSVAHLHKIVQVARNVPEVQFWLSTREYGMVREYLAAYGPFPANLTVRLSAHKIDGPLPDIAGLPASGVYSDKPQQGAKVCVAQYQQNECRDCRACWDSSVPQVTYPEH